MDLNGEHVQIMDTTLRDGEQTQDVSFTPLEKTNLAKALLGNLGVDRIEVASARISAGEQQGVKAIVEWAATEGHLEKVEILGFVDHHASADWILACGAKVMNLLTKGSEKHCHKQLKKTLHEHVKEIKSTVAYAISKGLKVNVYLEDWSNGYKDKPQYVFEMMELLKDIGIHHFMLPDTLGVMCPSEVFESMSDMCQRFPWATFDFHPHNDYGLGTANALFAVKAGIRTVHCTMNCLGERAGNASLTEIAVVLKDKLNVSLSIQEKNLALMSEMLESFSGKRMAGNAPIVGTDVFTQTSGIHADGDKKGNLYANPIHPERFGRTRSYALGKMSGKASLAKNLEQLGLQLSEENQKKVLQRIVQLGDAKKKITPSDLPFLITDILESHSYQRIELLNCTLTSSFGLEATAAIRVRIDEEDYSTTGSGNGGYDAFMSAIRKILKKKNISSPVLVDYEIRIPKGGKTNALTESLITWELEEKRFLTTGIDPDQVIAAVNATLKMLNLHLLQSQNHAVIEKEK